MIRFLACLNLLLLAGVLAMVLLVQTAGYRDAAHWWHEAKANEFEWRACETKRDILKKQIQKEGLWRRLGLSDQPWL